MNTSRLLKILVAEDEALLALDMELSFAELGITCVVVATLSEATALAEGHQFDAAVLDICLGKEDSFPAAKVLQRRGIPFLFHSGHAMRSEVEREFPGVTLLNKPVIFSRIHSEILKLVGKEGLGDGV